MYGFIVLIPFPLIRFSLLSKLNRNAVKRAAHFSPMIGNEIVAYWIYQISNIAIFIYICFLSIVIEHSWLFYLGMMMYVIGLALCTITIINFASPTKTGLHQTGIYRFSRNPMYVSYFFLFMGCALLTRSLLLGMFVLVFQIATHWIILSEERWCIEQFDESYK